MSKRDKISHKKIVFFDFDGVIADTFDIAFSIMRKEFSALSRPDYRKGFEININEAIKIWSAKGLAEKKLPAKNFFDGYTPRLLRLSPIPGVPKAIRALSKNHVLLIISSTISPSIRRFLAKFRLARYFNKIYGNEIQTSKVKKFRLALREFKARPDDCVFITDTLGDIKEAKKTGIKSLAVAWGYHPRKTLKKGAPLKILLKPAQLVKSVEEALKTPL